MAFLQDDDTEETLQAALSFVESFEASNSSPTQERAELQSQQHSQPSNRRILSLRKSRTEINERKRWLRKAGVYGDPNRARKAQSQEISLLREQFQKLQVDLQVLEKKREAAQKETTALALTSHIPSLWQTLADRQRQRREEAEQTNTRLKLAIDHHQKLADALKSLLQERASQLASDYSSFTELRFVKQHVVQELDFSRDSSEFRRLLLHIDEAYQDLDSIFETIGLNATIPGEVHIRERTSGKYQYFEFFSNNILPFDLKATKDATWSYFRGVEKHLGYGNLYNKAAKDLDEPYTILEDLTKELYSKNARADIRMKQVVRRYVENDRDVVVRVYRAVPVEIKHKILGRLTYQLQGYAVTKPAPVSSPGREVSMLQLCTLVFFDREEVSRACDPDSLRAFTEFLITHTAQNTRAHYDLISNALVDQALAQFKLAG
ncbi:hypothetical protein DVH05_008190 [Phytophthora capsici]|nr:hypothetical protein DVH05_008190 [Phytophthora capsici]